MTLKKSLLAVAAAGLMAMPAFAATGAGDGVDPIIFRLAIFVLAIFVGYYVVWSVTPALHTPLMSVTNAISGVVIVGAIMATAATVLSGDGEVTREIWIARGIGALALIFASINIFGGFMVTRRMLAMYKKKAK